MLNVWGKQLDTFLALSAQDVVTWGALACTQTFGNRSASKENREKRAEETPKREAWLSMGGAIEGNAFVP